MMTRLACDLACLHRTNHPNRLSPPPALKTIAAAVLVVQELYAPQPRSIVLKTGVHYLNATLELGLVEPHTF